MTKISNISGFPEWLPEEKLFEDQVIASIKRIYEGFGYTPIETPAIELVSTLASKGVIDKEIYAVRRLQASPDEEADLALHFDLTVPFARYVAQHSSKLVFPFKRYQIQKAWRGDRPQRGRFREFYQFDVDVIARDSLPLSCDAEILTMFDRGFSALGVGEFKIRLNDRKILLGFYASLGLSAVQAKGAIVVVDKIDKIGPDGVRAELVDKIKVPAEAASRIVDLAQVKAAPEEIDDVLRRLGVNDEEFKKGQADLLRLLELIPASSRAKMIVDLSLARGLDYYTGVIFEVFFPRFPEFGTAGSGGRYDNLCSQFCDLKLPGVGASIGITRVMDLVFSNQLQELKRRTTAHALVAVYSEEQRTRCNEFADELRAAGVNTEVFFASPKLGKQIAYAEAKGIRYVFFLNANDGRVEVKDLQSKEQVAVSDPKEWARLAGLVF